MLTIYLFVSKNEQNGKTIKAHQTGCERKEILTQYLSKHQGHQDKFVKIVEVGPRDGLQNEKQIISL